MQGYNVFVSKEQLEELFNNHFKGEAVAKLAEFDAGCKAAEAKPSGKYTQVFEGEARTEQSVIKVVCVRHIDGTVWFRESVSPNPDTPDPPLSASRKPKAR